MRTSLGIPLLTASGIGRENYVRLHCGDFQEPKASVPRTMNLLQHWRLSFGSKTRLIVMLSRSAPVSPPNTQSFVNGHAAAFRFHSPSFRASRLKKAPEQDLKYWSDMHRKNMTPFTFDPSRSVTHSSLLSNVHSLRVVAKMNVSLQRPMASFPVNP